MRPESPPQHPEVPCHRSAIPPSLVITGPQSDEMFDMLEQAIRDVARFAGDRASRAAETVQRGHGHQ